MSHNTLPTVAELSGEMRERLAKVKYVFTDLDATMLAPGSCVLRDNDGNPSTKLVEAVVALARAGIQAVSYTHLDVYKRQEGDCRRV